MREHEVPTHVQAEDKVLLWFTFPQIVAVTAVCALSYGAYHYAPVGPTEVRVALAAVLGLLAGIAMIVGKIGGRGLPLVAADLLRFRLVARRYAGTPAQLARSEPPAPVQSGPSLLSLMVRRAERLWLLARRAGRGIRRLRSGREHRNGRMPLRPRGWFGRWKGRRGVESTRSNARNQRARTLEARRRKTRKDWLAALAVAVLALAGLAVPHEAALAWGPWDEAGWRLDEIEFEPPEPVSGRRLFVEGLTVAGGRAEVTLRAAADLELRVRAFGGPGGWELRFWGAASLAEGERIDLLPPPHRGRALPHLLLGGHAGTVWGGDPERRAAAVPPAIGGRGTLRPQGHVPELESGEHRRQRRIRLRVRRQGGRQPQDGGWAPQPDGAGSAGRFGDRRHGDGHRHRGRVAEQLPFPFVPGGETRFSLPVEEGEAVHSVGIAAGLQASLRVPLPPLVQLTDHPAWTERITRRVSLSCPGGPTVSRTVQVSVVHEGHVRAEVVQRAPITRSRGETVALALSVGSDAPFRTLVVPPPAPEPEPALQTPAGDEEVRGLFDRLGLAVAMVEAVRNRPAARRRGAGVPGRGPGGAGGDAAGHERRADGDGLRRLGPLPLRRRLGGLRPDGGGWRGGQGKGQERRHRGGGGTCAGALGQGGGLDPAQRRRPHPVASQDEENTAMKELLQLAQGVERRAYPGGSPLCDGSWARGRKAPSQPGASQRHPRPSRRSRCLSVLHALAPGGGRAGARGRGAGGNLRGAGTGAGRAQAGGLRRGAQRPGLPGAAAGAPTPARPETACGRACSKRSPSDLLPADAGRGRVPAGTAHGPGGPRRHPGPSLLRHMRARGGRRAARVCWLGPVCPCTRSGAASCGCC